MAKPRTHIGSSEWFCGYSTNGRLSCGPAAPCQSPLRQNVSLLTGDPSKMIKTRPIRRPTSEEPQDYSDPPTYDVRQRHSINLSTCIRQLAMFRFRHLTDEAAKRQQPTQREVRRSEATGRRGKLRVKSSRGGVAKDLLISQLPRKSASSSEHRGEENRRRPETKGFIEAISKPQAACLHARERQRPQYKVQRTFAGCRETKKTTGCGFLRTKTPATETKRSDEAVVNSLEDQGRTWISSDERGEKQKDKSEERFGMILANELVAETKTVLLCFRPRTEEGCGTAPIASVSPNDQPVEGRLFWSGAVFLPTCPVLLVFPKGKTWTLPRPLLKQARPEAKRLDL
ncbi:unnamed protein product [Caenorhabditis auriculariae]|uniref:Uncharacterized protein n=1 Tax=Caenorhabditis auriculariae TaxID=2777116 RepID=A0A8S1HP82_9PELO|nr:unnamed protein product [Caenorhabditis auriculariae]